jgi:hypothetical protein
VIDDADAPSDVNCYRRVGLEGMMANGWFEATAQGVPRIIGRIAQPCRRAEQSVASPNVSLLTK